MKRPALRNKQVALLRMAFRARKVLGIFEKQGPGACFSKSRNFSGGIFKTKVFRVTKRCSYFNFYSLYNMWKDQLYKISGSEF